MRRDDGQGTVEFALLLPVVLVVVLFAVLVAAGDGDVRAFLLATWAGRCCLGTAVLLDAAAVVVMRRIVAGVSA